jgi:DNA-binding SARP family transcriptional activator
MLRLKSLGDALIEAGDVRLTPSAESVFATALYLIIEAGRPVGRDELTRLLWPGVSEAQAQHGLRQALYRLKSLGATIKADRSSLVLSPRFCSTDFAELLAPQPPTILETLANDINGSFLPGYRPQLSEAFATWVERQRDVVHSAVARALVAGIQAKKRVSDWSGAEQLATMCLTIDPLNEEATLTVAEAAALGGSKTKALSILNHYLKDIGDDSCAIKLPAVLLRRRISEAYQNNVFSVRDAPFVGRDEEMAELTRALARAQSGRGAAYVISGEPGIGKTRLVSEFTRVASLQRVHVVRVGCQSHDVRRPLSAFVDLVPKLLALPGALGCSPESMQFLRRLTAHDPEEARNRDQLEQSSISYDSARRALLDTLDAVSAETCILLEVEDAQWLDSHSVRMVEEISNWLGSRRLLFLITSRTSAYGNERMATLMLRPLPRDAGSLVARALANEKIVAREDFLEWCVSSSGGNPYYLIELLRNGTEERDGYQASASLTRLLQNRVQLLDSDARSLLEVCCILGKHSTMERIASCLDVPRTAILRSLEELDTSGMIEVDGPRVLSRHDLLSSVVLSQMSGAVKGMLHRYAAEQLEAESAATQAVSLIWESAEHWLAAADAQRAILLLRRCGNYLMDVGMPDEAARVLGRAESLATEAGEKYSIGAERVRAFMRAEKFSDAVELLEGLIPLRESVSPTPSRLDEVGLMYFQARWERGDSVPELASECLDAFASHLASPQEAIAAAVWLLIAADNLCDAALGHQIYERVSCHLRSTSVARESRLLFEMIYHCSFGERSLSQSSAERLAEYARGECSPLVAVRYLRLASYVFRCHGPAEKALALAKESHRIAEKVNAVMAMSASAFAIGSIFMQIGDIDAAEHWVTNAAKAHSQDSFGVAAANTWGDLAELAIRRGNADSGEFFYRACIPALVRNQSARIKVRMYALEAQIALLRGDTIREDILQAYLAHFAVSKSASMQDFNAESLILALESVGRHDDARRVCSEYVSKDRRDSCELSPPLVVAFQRLCISDPITNVV